MSTKSIPTLCQMIATTGKSETNLFDFTKKHCVAFYYIFSLATFQLLFLPMNCDSEHYNIYTLREAGPRLTTVFVGTFAVGAPLIYEFVLDQFLSWYNPKYRKALSNHRMADMLTIAPMFVTGIIALISDKFTLELAYIIVGLGQCLLLCGLYGRLLSLSHSKWTCSVCTLQVAVYTASQVLGVYHIHDCGDFYCTNRTELNISLALNALCLALHMYFSKHLFIRSGRVAVNSKASEQEFIPKYSQILNVAIIALYLFVRLVFLSIELGKHAVSISNLLEYNLFLLIAVAVVAGAMPGRIVRLGMMNLKSEMEYKETFVRYISHEIRSPLSTTTLGLDYLLQQMSSKLISYEEAIDVIKDAKISADLATSTMNDLLMFDKISTSKFEIYTTVTRAWSFVVNCVRPFRTQTRVSKLDLTCTIDTPQHKDVTVLIDQPKIEQVVRNFLTNAIKFTQAGGSLAVRVSVLPEFSNGNPSGLSKGDQGILRVSLTDTGPGISQENLPKLFGQYVQFDANKLQHGSGSGLGLWLSKSIVEMHGGYIGAHSEGEGKGCVFFFELPCYAHVSHNGSASSTSSKSMAQSIHFHGAGASMRHENTPRRDCRDWENDDVDDADNGADQGENSGHSIHSFACASVSSSIKNSVRAHVQELAHRMAVAKENGNRAGAARGERDFYISARQNSDRSGEKEESVRGSESSEAVSSVATYPMFNTQAATPVSRKVGSVTRVGDKENAEIRPEIDMSASVATNEHPPAQAQQPQQQMQVQSGQQQQQQQQQGGGRKVERLLRVLLADDAPISRKMVARTLTEFCQSIDHASNGLDALNAVIESMRSNEMFDVVIIDNYMPVMNGSEAIAAMRKHGYKGVILSATGSTSTEDYDLLMNSGADAVVLKPLNLLSFKTVMNELMELSKIDLPMKF